MAQRGQNDRTRVKAPCVHREKYYISSIRMLLSRALQRLGAAPAGVRMLRTTPSRLGMLTVPMHAGGTAMVNPDKFVTGETVAEHQVRVRHDNNAFRTHNYAVIGEP